MTSKNVEMRIIFAESLQQIAAPDWDALNDSDYPFTRYAFLRALADSGCVGVGTGWQEQHVLVYRHQELIAAMPLYVKMHSYGEYVFDWAWADAYQRYGLNYYPKLVTAIPFTPCTGSRLLLKNHEDAKEILNKIIDAIKFLAQKINASSWHCLFPPEPLSSQLNDVGITQRIGTQFHWYNDEYRDWNDFLSRMVSRKRKNITKERRVVVAQGITFSEKSGQDIVEQDCELFYHFYCNTYLKRSGHKGYLTRQFFSNLQKYFSNNILIIFAYHNNNPIAASFFFKDSTTLYGRYWGCESEYAFLHFETCYYQGIEYAINHGLARFDGGAQGEHKIQRGFEPVTTYSNHWLAQAEFQTAIDNFLATEKISVEQYRQSANEHLPFK